MTDFALKSLVPLPVGLGLLRFVEPCSLACGDGGDGDVVPHHPARMQIGFTWR